MPPNRDGVPAGRRRLGLGGGFGWALRRGAGVAGSGGPSWTPGTCAARVLPQAGSVFQWPQTWGRAGEGVLRGPHRQSRAEVAASPAGCRLPCGRPKVCGGEGRVKDECGAAGGVAGQARGRSGRPVWGPGSLRWTRNRPRAERGSREGRVTHLSQPGRAAPRGELEVAEVF